MKTGIASGAYFGLYGSLSAYKKMKAHGYDCVDYQNFCHTDTELFNVSDKEFEKKLLQEKDLAKEAGIEIFQTHGPWRWPPRDSSKEERDERFAKMEKSIWGNSILDCKYFIIHPIMPFGDNQEPDTKAFQDINYEFFGRLVEVAKSHDVVICLENMPMPALSLARPSEILEFVKNINSDYMQVCLDTGHCAVVKESVGEAVRLTGKYLKTLHIHDNNGQSDLHWLPYNGVIDWPDFKKAIKEIDYQGCMSIETNVSKKLPEDIQEYFQIGLGKIARDLTLI